MSQNILDYMEIIHIDQAFDLLEEKFGFPKKVWKKAFNEYLDKQPRKEDDLGIFLRFGNDRINPLLNGILVRNPGHPTFNKLCEYLVKKSPNYLNDLNRRRTR